MKNRLTLVLLLMSLLMSCTPKDVVMKSIIGNWKTNIVASETNVQVTIREDMSAVLFFLDEKGNIEGIMTGSASYDGKATGTLNVEVENEPESLLTLSIKAVSSNSFQLLIKPSNEVWVQVYRTETYAVPSSIAGAWETNTGEGGEYILHVGQQSDTALIFTEGADIVAFIPVKVKYDSNTGLGSIISESYPWDITATSATELLFSYSGEKICSMKPTAWIEGYPTSLDGTWEWNYMDEGELVTIHYELTKSIENLYVGKYISIMGTDKGQFDISVEYDPTTGKGAVYDETYEKLFVIQGIHPTMFFASYGGEDPAGTFVKIQ